MFYYRTVMTIGIKVWIRSGKYSSNLEFGFDFDYRTGPAARPLMIATIFPMGTKYDCNLYYKRNQI